VRVPEGAGKGNARITLSFADWKEGKVMPATFEIPIMDPKPMEEAVGKDSSR
jgi:hypothetical protein